jgi:hypothetical protein
LVFPVIYLHAVIGIFVVWVIGLVSFPNNFLYYIWK